MALGIIFICVAILCIYALISNSGKGNASSNNKQKNCIWCNKNNTKEVKAIFRDGVVYYPQYNSVMGYYNNNGDVYNASKEKIGYVHDIKMYMSREFLYERLLETLPETKIKKPSNMVHFLGEVVGNSSGTIFEDSNCDNATAYFELQNENFLGAGAAYLLLVYEDLVSSNARSFYHMDVNECL